MSTTIGPLEFANAASVSGSPGGSVQWINPENVLDDRGAAFADVTGESNSQWLLCTGIAGLSIPDAAIIEAVRIQVDRFTDGSVTDVAAQLWHDGAPIGTSIPDDDWPLESEPVVYPFSGIFLAEGLTGAHLKAGSFGFGIVASSGGEAFIERVRVLDITYLHSGRRRKLAALLVATGII